MIPCKLYIIVAVVLLVGVVCIVHSAMCPEQLLTVDATFDLVLM